MLTNLFRRIAAYLAVMTGPVPEPEPVVRKRKRTDVMKRAKSAQLNRDIVKYLMGFKRGRSSSEIADEFELCPKRTAARMDRLYKEKFVTRSAIRLPQKGKRPAYRYFPSESIAELYRNNGADALELVH